MCCFQHNGFHTAIANFCFTFGGLHVFFLRQGKTRFVHGHARVLCHDSSQINGKTTGLIQKGSVFTGNHRFVFCFQSFDNLQEFLFALHPIGQESRFFVRHRFGDVFHIVVCFQFWKSTSVQVTDDGNKTSKKTIGQM